MSEHTDPFRALVAHSTREIVQDQQQSKKLGHNPSWYKAADVLQALLFDRANRMIELQEMRTLVNQALEASERRPSSEIHC